MPRSLLTLTLQYVLAIGAVAQSLPTQTLGWTIPNRDVLPEEPLAFFAEIIGNGTLAPTGAVTFQMAGKPIAITPVAAVTNKNYLRYSSQFDKPVWTPLNKNSVLTPDYAPSPLNDQTAYRYRNVAETGGTYISQEVRGLPGTHPVTFSIWIKATEGRHQDVPITIFDHDHKQRVPQHCYLSSYWQRCSVTAPQNPTSVTVLIGSDWWDRWDAIIWGAQVETSTSPGVYVKSGDTPAVATFGLATFVATCCLDSGPVSETYTGEKQQTAGEPIPSYGNDPGSTPDDLLLHSISGNFLIGELAAGRDCSQATIGGQSITGDVMQRDKNPLPYGEQKPLAFARVDIYSLSGGKKPLIVVFTRENGWFDSGVLPGGDYRLEVSGWGSTTVHLNPNLGKDGFGSVYWVDLLDDNCIGAGQSSN